MLTVEYEAQSRGFSVKVFLDRRLSELEKDEENQISLDWNLFKIQLYHCLQSEIVCKSNSNDIHIKVSLINRTHDEINLVTRVMEDDHLGAKARFLAGDSNRFNTPKSPDSQHHMI